MGGCKSLMLFFGGFLLLLGKRTCDFAFVSLRYGRSGEEICRGYMPWPPAAECNMITNKQTSSTIPNVKVRMPSITEGLSEEVLLLFSSLLGIQY